jgi:hypothetical protein
VRQFTSEATKKCEEEDAGEGGANPLFLFLISISGLDWLFLYPLPPPKRNPSNLETLLS